MRAAQTSLLLRTSRTNIAIFVRRGAWSNARVVARLSWQQRTAARVVVGNMRTSRGRDTAQAKLLRNWPTHMGSMCAVLAAEWLLRRMGVLSTVTMATEMNGMRTLRMEKVSFKGGKVCLVCNCEVG